jgi:hypothetical protein
MHALTGRRRDDLPWPHHHIRITFDHWNRRVPIARQLVARFARDFLEPLDHAACLRQQEFADNVVAEPLSEERPERVAVPVREIMRVLELLDRRQPAMQLRIAQPHVREGVGWPKGQVLGHPFDEPAGQVERVLMCAFRDVDLKGVGELVAEDVVGFTKSGRKRDDDARPYPFREATGAFADGPRVHIGLSKLPMACVQDDRLAASEGVIQELRVARVPPLRHASRLAGDVFLLRVVVDVEVLGAERTEFQPCVLDLVAAKVLRPGRDRTHQQRRRETHEHRRAPKHGHP